MSNLVNDFLIEPVLRHARHFSRSNAQCDSIANDSSTATTASSSRLEVTIKDVSEDLRDLGISKNDTEEADSVDGTVITDSRELASYDSSVEVDVEPLDISTSISYPDNTTSEETPVFSDSESTDLPVLDDSLPENSNSLQESASASVEFSPATINEHEDVEDNILDPLSRQPTLDGVSNGNEFHQRPSLLPEDDGMSELRQQILSIQAMDVNPEEKAYLMHQLLNRNHIDAQDLSKQQQATSSAPSATISQERPTTPGSLSFFLWQMNISPDPSTQDKNHTFHLSPEDLKPTFTAIDSHETDDSPDVASRDEVLVLGCQHYQRNVKLQCSACEKWYTCRLCHDEVEDHVLNRKATKNMLCMLCGFAQRAAEFCVKCSERSAWYYCEVCKLWDNDTTKSIYHCNDCGICRKGLGIGKDFFHCKTCGTCMSASVENSHKCIERVSDCDCPICGEYMFTSPSPVVFMFCGHSIHKACYDEHLKLSYKCPICSKSTVNMETQFRNLDRAVDNQPMPPQFQDTKAMIYCNDCFAKTAVPYHWLGLKCAICDSYNTAQLSILSGPNLETSTERPELENDTPVEVANPERLLTLPGSSLLRQRRHSAHVHPVEPNESQVNRFSPGPRPLRNVRSVSPIAPYSFSDASVSLPTDKEDSEEDELDFWGLDEPRSITSGENLDEETEGDDSDEDSALEDCEDGEEEDEEEDEFALFGHR